MSESENQSKKADFKDLWEVKSRITAHKDLINAKRKMRLKDLCELNPEISPEKIAEKFSYETMQKEYRDFCLLYGQNKACHEIKDNDFNCYGCYCPNYNPEITLDESSGLYKIGICKVKSKFGHYRTSQTLDDAQKEYLILSCINCTVPHRKTFIKKFIEIEKEKNVYEQ